MRVYWEVAKRGYGRYATYRAATVAGVATNTIFGFIRAYVLLAVFRARPGVGGFDAVDAVTFTFVTQGLMMPLGAFGRREIADRIKTGDVVSDLYRPMDFQGYWFAHDMGRGAFLLIARGIPPVVLGALVFHLRLPSQPTTWLAFAVALVIAMLISFSVQFMVGLTGFWLIDDRGPNQLATTVQFFLSGMLLPLVLFPAWLATIARNSPFGLMVELPVEILLGKHPGTHVVPVYALGLLWAGVLLLGGRLVLAAATRKVVVQGG